ncbi:MAG: hypothetical protein WHX52_22275 [Anaerolineae bacterium]
MSPVRLQRHTFLWGLVACGAVVVSICAMMLYRAYRQGCLEHQVVAELLSKSPQGEARVGSPPSLSVWYNWVCEVFGIPKPIVYLTLTGPQINDGDLAQLTVLRHLENLTIDSCPITDDGVRKIAQLRTVRYLIFAGPVNITDASFNYLGTMRSLETLAICDFPPKITGRNVEKLRDLPNLAVLDLACCLKVSDQAIEGLTQLKQLKNLDIRCTSISEPGVRRLERGLPNTIILSDHPFPEGADSLTEP